MKRTTFPLVSLSMLALAVSAQVHAADESHERLIEARLAKLEAEAANKSSMPENISFSGLIEVEASAGEVDGDSNSESYSDLAVATVELNLNAKINDKVSADLIVLYEEGETDLNVDVATIDIDQLIGPVNLSLGKMYVPFGRFETALVNDTLVLEAAETNKTAALFGMEQNGLSVGAYVFRGDADREDHVENYGFTSSFEQENFGVGLDYISALTESDALADGENYDEWAESAPAFSVSGHLALGDVTLLAEYLAATSEIVAAGETEGFEPSVWQLEADLGADVNGQSFTFAIAYQESDDAAGFLPESRISLGCSTDIYENVTLGAEFWHDEDYSEADNGSGAESDNIVVQLAVSF